MGRGKGREVAFPHLFDTVLTTGCSFCVIIELGDSNVINELFVGIFD